MLVHAESRTVIRTRPAPNAETCEVSFVYRIGPQFREALGANRSRANHPSPAASHAMCPPSQSADRRMLNKSYRHYLGRLAPGWPRQAVMLRDTWVAMQDHANEARRI